MLQIETWKRVLIWGLVALGLLLALPNLFYPRVERYNDEVAAQAGDSTGVSGWPGFLPSGLVNLGLDLRGGAHLLAEVRVAEVYQTRMEGLWPEVRNLLRDHRDEVGTIRLLPSEDGTLVVRIGDAAGLDRAVELVRGLAQPVASLTGAGASDIVVSGEGDTITVQLSEAERLATDDRTVRQSLEIIRRRIRRGRHPRTHHSAPG